jgi:hypothetical protein
MAQVMQHRVSGEQESLANGIRRAGHIAGVAAMSVVVFGSLYFLALQHNLWVG